MRAAAYLRAKAGERSREDAILLEQRLRVEEHVAAQGWELVAVYEDAPGRTPRPGDHPGLYRLLENLDGLDKVVVVSLDRFRPGARGSLNTIQRLSGEGVGLVSLDEAFDTRGETGTAIPKVLRLAARWESRLEAGAAWGPEHLQKPGFDPVTVIDVGAGNGTPDLYRAFPDAYLVLLEPLREHREDLERLIAQRPGEFLTAAVGSHEGTVTIGVNHRQLFISSILERTEEAVDEQALERREIPVTTLDALLAEGRWRPPFGLKIDTEGYEHHVIRGAARLLEDTQFVLAELGLVKHSDENYSFAEFVSLMDEHGFRLCDVLKAPKAMANHEATFMDAIFRPVPG